MFPDYFSVSYDYAESNQKSSSIDVLQINCSIHCGKFIEKNLQWSPIFRKIVGPGNYGITEKLKFRIMFETLNLALK